MGRRQAFIDAMMGYVNDDSHGYDQSNRWGPDFDCSSLCYQCAYDAGYDVPTDDPRYTGTMVEDFTHAGFTRLDPGVTLVPGDICLNRTHHVMMYVQDSPDLLAGARINEHGHACGGTQGDQTGSEICTEAYYDYPWTDILRPPADDDQPTPTLAPSDGSIDEDGFWGEATTRKAQEHFGTTVDGVVSGQPASNRSHCLGCYGWEWVADSQAGGSDLIRAIQQAINADHNPAVRTVDVDGFCGPDTICGLEEHEGVGADGILSSPSDTIRSMQRDLNAGTF